jgi:biopolymer transport protein ExbD
MKFQSAIPASSSGFSMAPMMDIVFLLLCFFITTQIFAQWETEIDITLPTAVTGEVQQRLPGEIIINVKEDGEIWVNQRSLSVEELGGVLQDLSALYPGQPVLIRADHDADFKYVIGVLDRCRAADIWNISFATNVPDS